MVERASRKIVIKHRKLNIFQAASGARWGNDCFTRSTQTEAQSAVAYKGLLLYSVRLILYFTGLQIKLRICLMRRSGSIQIQPANILSVS